MEVYAVSSVEQLVGTGLEIELLDGLFSLRIEGAPLARAREKVPPEFIVKSHPRRRARIDIDLVSAHVAIRQPARAELETAVRLPSSPLQNAASCPRQPSSDLPSKIGEKRASSA